MKRKRQIDLDGEVFAKFGALGLSVVLLVISLFGLTRQWQRTGVPFTWDEREQRLIIRSVIAAGLDLMPGDILLANDQTPLRHTDELEFLLGGRRRGEALTIIVLRQGKALATPIILTDSWYTHQYIFINLILGLALWGIGTWVFIHKPEDRPARIFFLLTINLATGIMLITSHLPAGAPPWNYFLPVFNFTFYPFFPALLLHFAAAFPREKLFARTRQLQNFVIYFPAVIFVLLLQISHLRALLSHDISKFREYYVVFTWHRGYLVGYSLLAVAALMHTWRAAADNSEKNKVRWILWGIAAGAAPFVFLWTLPKMIMQSALIPEEIALLALIIAPLSFALAIVKYKIFAIDVVINRSIVYTLLTGFIIGLYLLLAGLTGKFLQTLSAESDSFIAIACTLIAALVFNPAKQKIQQWVDVTFYRVKYNYRLATREFSQLMMATTSQTETLALLMQHIEAAIPVEQIAILLTHEDSLQLAASHGIPADEKERLNLLEYAKLLQRVKSANQLNAPAPHGDFGTALWLSSFENFNHGGMELLIPVAMNADAWNFLLLGRKRSGAKYEAEDLELLSMLANEAFSALERIRFQEAAIQERAEKEKLAALSLLKSEFISLVSHELRTPLTAIRWSVQNLLDGIPEKPSPKIENYLRGIYDSSSHLSRMIENLLDVSKIEADKIELFPERLPLKETIAAVLQLLTPLAGKKNLRLQMEVPAALHLYADRDALQEILSNLIENAIKYSPEGKKILVEARHSDSDNKTVAMSVHDEGIGISPEKQKNIFDKFERVTQDQKAREKGLGLGLYIVKKLIEAQNGTIGVQSEVGKGSRFTIYLPAA